VPIPRVFFSAANFSVNESAGTVTISVNLNTSTSNTITVDYATSDGSAIAPGDYTTTINTLTFTPGQTTRTFTIPINNDGNAELDEIFSVTLSNPVNATLGTPNPATVTIIDDDIPSVQFDSGLYSVNENAGPAVITVTLSIPSPLTVTVNYATSNGTATVGSDYTSTGGTLIFPPNQTSINFTVPITDDSLLYELTETVNLTLSSPSNATLGTPNPATLEIVDDDYAAVQFSSTDYTVAEGSGSATITVTLSAPAPISVTVDYATSNGTAIAGSDYIAASGTLTFAPGDTIGTFTVSIINDAGQENSETLSLDLSNSTNAILGSTNPATLTITDSDTATCGNTAGSIGIGPPDCIYTYLGGTTITVTLSTPINVDGDTDPTDFELVYYERESPPPDMGNIALDWVRIEVGTSPTGPWQMVFDWGDTVADSNSNIYQEGYGDPSEPNDWPIPLTSPPLYRSTQYGIASGIAIDLDAVVTPGTYGYVRVIGGGTAEVDSIEILP
jgi:hypothetical protein